MNDGGTQVFDLEFQPGYLSSGVGDTELATTNTINHSPPSPKTVGFPQGIYYEIVARETSGTAASCPYGTGGSPNCLLYDAWEWPVSGGVEWDFVEVYANRLAGGAAHPGNNPPPYGIGLDWTAYHTFGMRITTDGNSGAMCSYLDGSQVGCGIPFSPIPQVNNYLRLSVGPLNTNGYPNGSGGYSPPTQNQDFYIKSVRVWSCASWQTTQCTGTVLTGSP